MASCSERAERSRVLLLINLGAVLLLSIAGTYVVRNCMRRATDLLLRLSQCLCLLYSSLSNNFCRNPARVLEMRYGKRNRVTSWWLPSHADNGSETEFQTTSRLLVSTFKKYPTTAEDPPDSSNTATPIVSPPTSYYTHTSVQYSIYVVCMDKVCSSSTMAAFMSVVLWLPSQPPTIAKKKAPWQWLYM